MRGGERGGGDVESVEDKARWRARHATRGTLKGRESIHETYDCGLFGSELLPCRYSTTGPL
eukprot:1608184-Pyramimonas_sp.AAC.1